MYKFPEPLLYCHWPWWQLGLLREWPSRRKAPCVGLATHLQPVEKHLHLWKAPSWTNCTYFFPPLRKCRRLCSSFKCLPSPTCIQLYREVQASKDRWRFCANGALNLTSAPNSPAFTVSQEAPPIARLSLWISDPKHFCLLLELTHGSQLTVLEAPDPA